MSRNHERSRPSRGAVRAGAALICLLVALACSSDGDSGTPTEPFVQPAEYLRFDFDGRDWSAASQKRIGRLVQEIFVLPNESTTEWTEIVNSSIALGAQRGTDIGALIESQKTQLEKECPIVQFETLVQSKRSALYEWRRPQCKDLEPQLQIARVVFGRLGIHTLTYTAKASRIAPGLRKQWLNSLRSAELESRQTTR